jgi:hypothetical protein
MPRQSKLSKAEKAALFEALDQRVRNIRTREDLAAFATMLGNAYLDGLFEEAAAPDCLFGVTGALHNLRGYCRNQGLPDPQQPDWRWMGEILYLAVYNV